MHPPNNWEHDPKAALHSLAINSGMLRFYEIEELAAITTLNNTSNQQERVTNLIGKIRKEMKEEFPKENQSNLISAFKSAIDIRAPLIACGSCGIRSFKMGHENFVKIGLNELKLLKCNEERYKTIKKVQKK